ncbi:CLUMA_CG003553, isoform A [Clunio marinus]|uniref:CLUMA_CG003553, isoform A n=1 Tax=Clunio marinus TaxID=568069 RepID=A0A1J1HTS5_9DIPT|nr:CLUMA_CG003553, isoform A [Clunio marinus]
MSIHVSTSIIWKQKCVPGPVKKVIPQNIRTKMKLNNEFFANILKENTKEVEDDVVKLCLEHIRTKNVKLFSNIEKNQVSLKLKYLIKTFKMYYKKENTKEVEDDVVKLCLEHIIELKMSNYSATLKSHKSH